MNIEWRGYDPNGFYDEMMRAPAQAHALARGMANYPQTLSSDEVRARQQAAEAAIVQMGITFTVYSEGGNIDRAWPFDIIPRIIAAQEWAVTEAGLRQRLRALNLFINDLYGPQLIVRDGVFPPRALGRLQEFPPRVHRHPAASRRVGTHLRQ